ncbi:hypothetical protein B0H13DRAFT_2318277 [Mycena leptocephala]|nr:hypothetical protein B0H13DRAFT_2318277 [Mycena leptocephala]
MGMGYLDTDLSQPLHIDSKALHVAIIAENFLPKIDGSAVALAHLLQHLAALRMHAMLLGPEIGIQDCLGRLAFISPAFLRALRSSGPHVIRLVNPIWLGMQAVIALQPLSGYTLSSTGQLLREKSWANLCTVGRFR